MIRRNSIVFRLNWWKDWPINPFLSINTFIQTEHPRKDINLLLIKLIYCPKFEQISGKVDRKDKKIQNYHCTSIGINRKHKDIMQPSQRAYQIHPRYRVYPRIWKTIWKSFLQLMRYLHTLQPHLQEGLWSLPKKAWGYSEKMESFRHFQTTGNQWTLRPV